MEAILMCHLLVIILFSGFIVMEYDDYYNCSDGFCFFIWILPYPFLFTLIIIKIIRPFKKLCKGDGTQDIVW